MSGCRLSKGENVRGIQVRDITMNVSSFTIKPVTNDLHFPYVCIRQLGVLESLDR